MVLSSNRRCLAVAFGDIVMPESEQAVIPVFQDLPSPELKDYSVFVRHFTPPIQDTVLVVFLCLQLVWDILHP